MNTAFACYHVAQSMPRRSCSAVRWLPGILALATTMILALSSRSTASIGSLLRGPQALQHAMERVHASGYIVCRSHDQALDILDVPLCDQFSSKSTPRLLEEETSQEGGESVIYNFFAALSCVCCAALAAGLTLGLLGMDPLMLLIKQRAGATESERLMASKLLPVVQQHHRLLVTLLLLNAASNEALPIFLEALVSPTVAILLSVTLVLFFGEIIPSAIFTGPNQLLLASRLLPVVKLAMWILYPLAGPIAYLLDVLLHGEDHDNTGDYNRGELAALIRIQYEERLAHKRKRKQDQQHSLLLNGDHVGALDFSSVLTTNHRKSLRAARSQLEHSSRKESSIDDSNNGITLLQRAPSIHLDEVVMAEGALSMQTKVAIDVYTPVHKVFSIPSDMILDERNMVKIYACGFTRIPVYRPPDKSAICGLLMTKQLIVVNARDSRAVDTLPLRRPHCVSPEMPLVHLINLLQTGGNALQGGHMALVCARPHVGNKALQDEQEIPETAGLMGIITLEDVLEALLQEQIYDEMDKKEREATRLARMVCQQWKRYVRRKRAGRLLDTPVAPREEPALVDVVEDVMERANAVEATEASPLMERSTSSSRAVFLWFNQTPPRKKDDSS